MRFNRGSFTPFNEIQVMNKYTVLGYYEESGQTFAHHVVANNASQAFYVVAKEHPDANFITAIQGHHFEGKTLEFPGESVVSAETVLEQEDIFNLDDTKQMIVSELIADFEIQDWHLVEIGEGWSGPKEHRDNYRFIIQQSPTTNQIYFSVYPKAIDSLGDSLERNGLAGCIEIRNGKPAISLGINENALPVHIESNVFEGFYIHHDRGSEPVVAKFQSYDHGMQFDSHYYECSDSGWLMEARSEIANRHFEKYDFGTLIVADDSGWEIEDTHWLKTVFFENPNGGDTIRGSYDLTFGNDSIMVINESVS